MIFHTYGDKGNKAVVLIHGMLTPWQIWNTAAERFSKDHYVIVPELDAHAKLACFKPEQWTGEAEGFLS